MLYSDFNLSGAGIPWKTINGGTANEIDYTDWQLVDVSPGASGIAMGDSVTLKSSPPAVSRARTGARSTSTASARPCRGSPSRAPGRRRPTPEHPSPTPSRTRTAPRRRRAPRPPTAPPTRRRASAALRRDGGDARLHDAGEHDLPVVQFPGGRRELHRRAAGERDGDPHLHVEQPARRRRARAPSRSPSTSPLPREWDPQLVQLRHPLDAGDDAPRHARSPRTSAAAWTRTARPATGATRPPAACTPTARQREPRSDGSAAHRTRRSTACAPPRRGPWSARAGVCDTADNECGYENGDGPCTAGSAGKVCRSAVCDPDLKCGYANGDGPCTPGRAATAPPSAARASAAATASAMPGRLQRRRDCPGGRLVQRDHAHLHAEARRTARAVPTDPAHTNPTLNGTCTATAGRRTLVCVSGVCDANDNKCGYANGDGPCTPANGRHRLPLRRVQRQRDAASRSAAATSTPTAPAATGATRAPTRARPSSPTAPPSRPTRRTRTRRSTACASPGRRRSSA